MDKEHVFFVSNVQAPVLVAVEVNGSQVRTECVGTFRVLVVHVEALHGVILYLNTNYIKERII